MIEWKFRSWSEIDLAYNLRMAQTMIDNDVEIVDYDVRKDLTII